MTLSATAETSRAQGLAADPAASAWVSASAGSGKTKVLTDRVLRLLLTGAEPHTILCLTFTKAAAAEMENRLTQRLSRWAIMTSEDCAADLESLLGARPTHALLQTAQHLLATTLDAPRPLQIQTIHGFCQTLLKKFPLEAGIPPRFDVLDPFVASLLLKDLETQIFGLAATEAHASSSALQGAIHFFMSRLDRPHFQEILSAIIGEKSKFQRVLEKETLQALHEKQAHVIGEDRVPDEEAAILRELAGILKAAPLGPLITLLEAEGDAARQAQAAGLREWLEAAPPETLEDLTPALGFFLTQVWAPRRTLLLKAQREKHPELFAALVETQTNLRTTLERLFQARSLGFSKALLTLAEGILTLYETFKRRRGLLDYDDLIHRTLRLLEQPEIAPWVLYKIDGGIHHILVDEAQDTNADQWRLLTALTRDFFDNDPERHRTLFFVGDPKQSIYSFQGANPRLFLETRDLFFRETQESGRLFRSIQLSLSFRSTPAVLQAVDAVFSHPLRQNSLLVEEAVTHRPHRSTAAGRVQIWPLMHSAPEAREAPAPDDWTPTRAYHLSPHPRTLLAGRIAGVIASWLQEGRWLAGKNRPVAPSDILILVRQRGPFVGEMVRALKAQHVPVAGVDRLLLSDHIAVQDLLAFLRFVLCPDDDLSCAEVLKGPLVGFDESTLYHLAVDRGGQTLWQALLGRPEDTYQHAAQELTHLRATIAHKAPYDALATFLDALGGRACFIARLGAEAEDPLDECLSLAQAFEQTIRRPGATLQDFLSWVSAAPIEIKRDLQEASGGAVRIMTVHGAKGLQAPIVFLPDTVDLPQTRGSIFWHGTPPLPFWRMPKHERPESLARWLQGEKAATMAEYDRLLYVALTRAEDELYIAGWQPRGEPPADCWYVTLRESLEALAPLEEMTCPLTGETLAAPTLQDPIVLSKAQPGGHQSHEHPAPEAPLPGWVNTPPPAAPQLRRITPSSMALDEHLPFEGRDTADVDPEQERLRGIFIHRLLELLPGLPAQAQAALIPHIVQELPAPLAGDLQHICVREVEALLQNPDLAFLFTDGAQTEVEVGGMQGDAWVQGRIDRLILPPEADPTAPIWIVDYKTGAVGAENLESASKMYATQLALYRGLLRGPFPERVIKTALLWTRSQKLVILDV